MQKIIGLGQYIRAPDKPMKAGEIVIGHRHNFDHITYVPRGSFEISILKEVAKHISGWPARADVVFTKVVSSKDEENWFPILKGTFHSLKALEDNSIYHCIYADRMPTAVSILPPGQQYQPPVTKRDENDHLWMYVDETILTDSVGWVEAYR